MKTELEKDIIKILNQFEQRDYKAGGIFIAPENYDTIALEIKKTMLEKCDGVRWRDCEKHRTLEWGCEDCDFYLFKK